MHLPYYTTKLYVMLAFLEIKDIIRIFISVKNDLKAVSLNFLFSIYFWITFANGEIHVLVMNQYLCMMWVTCIICSLHSFHLYNLQFLKCVLTIRHPRFRKKYWMLLWYFNANWMCIKVLIIKIIGSFFVMLIVGIYSI